MIILKMRVGSASAWRDAYRTALPNGGLFVPTTTELTEGQDAIIELSSPLLPNKVMIRGEIRSWRPALPRLRVRAGAEVEFMADEAAKREFISGVFEGTKRNSPKRKQSRLPVNIPVRYRVANDTEFVECAISEISVGGAMLTTNKSLPLDAPVLIEFAAPGSAAPITISSKVSYLSPNGASGVKFLTRDSDGARRLRELVRRLRVA